MGAMKRSPGGCCCQALVRTFFKSTQAATPTLTLFSSAPWSSFSAPTPSWVTNFYSDTSSLSGDFCFGEMVPDTAEGVLFYFGEHVWSAGPTLEEFNVYRWNARSRSLTLIHSFDVAAGDMEFYDVGTYSPDFISGFRLVGTKFVFWAYNASANFGLQTGCIYGRFNLDGTSYSAWLYGPAGFSGYAYQWYPHRVLSPSVVWSKPLDLGQVWYPFSQGGPTYPDNGPGLVNIATGTVEALPTISVAHTVGADLIVEDTFSGVQGTRFGSITHLRYDTGANYLDAFRSGFTNAEDRQWLIAIDSDDNLIYVADDDPIRTLLPAGRITTDNSTDGILADPVTKRVYASIAISSSGSSYTSETSWKCLFPLAPAKAHWAIDFVDDADFVYPYDVLE